MASHRVRLAILATVCVIGAGAVALSLLRASHERVASAPPSRNGGTGAAVDANGPVWVFENTAAGPDYGRVGVLPADEPGGARTLTDLRCDRVDMAGGRGVCLVNDRVAFRYSLEVFDRDLRVTHRLALAGLPSRVRVAPDGAVAAYTIFVQGDSYAADSFSTRTDLVDLVRGRTLVDLERFSVYRNGRRFQAVDFNFWGVTFTADSQHFYATLGTGSHHYLIFGDIARRRADVVTDGVECPALSPDGTRVAFKVRNPADSAGQVTWRLWVLDLASGRRWPLAEEVNVDDQANWLDGASVLYAVPNTRLNSSATNTYVVPADGTGAPRLLIAGAWSATLTRAA